MADRLIHLAAATTAGLRAAEQFIREYRREVQRLRTEHLTN